MDLVFLRAKFLLCGLAALLSVRFYFRLLCPAAVLHSSDDVVFFQQEARWIRFLCDGPARELAL